MPLCDRIAGLKHDLACAFKQEGSFLLVVIAVLEDPALNSGNAIRGEREDFERHGAALSGHNETSHKK